MHLQPASTGLFPGDSLSATTIVPLPDPVTGQIVNDSRRIDVSCQGPFAFDMIRREAAFKSNVLVEHPAIAPTIHDRMTCDELRIFFGDRPRNGVPEPPAGIAAARENGRGNAAQLSLQVYDLPARGDSGNPVVIAAPSNERTARADELE